MKAVLQPSRRLQQHRRANRGDQPFNRPLEVDIAQALDQLAAASKSEYRARERRPEAPQRVERAAPSPVQTQPLKSGKPRPFRLASLEYVTGGPVIGQPSDEPCANTPDDRRLALRRRMPC